MSSLDLKSLDGFTQTSSEDMTLFKSISILKRRMLVPTFDLMIRFAFLLLTITGLWYYKRSPAISSASQKCNPFAQPGALFLNIENVTSTQWQPFDASCPSSHLLPLVQAVLESEAIDARHALPWLADKTMVLIGDSIERFSLDYFCELVDGDLSLIDLSHPYSPPTFKNGRDDLRENEEFMKLFTADGRPHMCRVDPDGLNFTLLSFFMYGSATYDEFVQQEKVFGRPHYFAPVDLRDRVDYWVQGVLQRANLQADAVQFSSCMWDVMHFSEIDGNIASSEDVVHAPFPTSERLDWYRSRLTTSLDKIETVFPQATLIWRRGHDVGCGQYHVPCARNAQLMSVADHVISQRQSRWHVDETGSLIRGHSEFYKDKVHPGEVFRTIWADSALYRLRESYYGKL